MDTNYKKFTDYYSKNYDPFYNLKKLLDTAKAGNPVSDIVDSWYIAKASYGSI